METTLYRITATLNKNGLKVKQDSIQVTEHSKCYDTIDGRSRRFRKQNLGKIDTNLKNDISSESPTIAFHTVVLKDDIEVAKTNILESIESRLETLKTGLSGIVEQFNKKQQ